MEPKTFPVEYAGLVSRSIAFVIDLVIIGLISLLGTILTGLILDFFGFAPGPVNPQGGQASLITILRNVIVIVATLSSTLFSLGYFLFFWVLAGYTPGKAFTGLRIVRSNGQRLTLGRAILRLVGYWISALPLFLGFLWIIIDNRRQSWHDKIADTCVVYAKRWE